MFKSLIDRIETTLHPERYHSQWMSAPFFEGWYFKIVDSSGMHRAAIIPGVFIDKDSEKSHAFIQVMDGASKQVVYHRFPVEQFTVESDPFSLRIGSNTFSLQQMSLDIQREAQTLVGRITFDSPSGWPVRWYSPGVMGWYAWVPNMECYHGVLGFDHAIHGVLEMDQQRLIFDHGRGYIEKDWGKAFPQAWIWMQSNHYDQKRVSFTASVAVIPWQGSAFAGFIVGLWLNGRLHRFATYANSRITHLTVHPERVVWHLQNRTHRLEIEASQADGGLLHAPTPEGMGRRIAETLNAKICLRLTHRKSGAVEFEGLGSHAGLEVVGDISKLIAMIG